MLRLRIMFDWFRWRMRLALTIGVSMALVGLWLALVHHLDLYHLLDLVSDVQRVDTGLQLVVEL